jgi:hypothetical protein
VRSDDSGHEVLFFPGVDASVESLVDQRGSSGE